jgi:hypothetical protein
MPSSGKKFFLYYSSWGLFCTCVALVLRCGTCLKFFFIHESTILPTVPFSFRVTMEKLYHHRWGAVLFSLGNPEHRAQSPEPQNLIVKLSYDLLHADSLVKSCLDVEVESLREPCVDFGRVLRRRVVSREEIVVIVGVVVV